MLHTRSCTGVGMHFLHFLTACYLVFSLECQSISGALNTLPPLKSSATVQQGGSAKVAFIDVSLTVPHGIGISAGTHRWSTI